MLNLDCNALPWNVLFDIGASKQLPWHMDQMGLSRAIVVSTPGRRVQALDLSAIIGDRFAALYDKASPHVPAAVVEDAIDAARQCEAECCISIGGGSTTGLGKVLALKLGLPNIAIPTSYAGSEMTNIWGITADGKKTTGRDDAVLPNLTIYDPLETISLPARASASSGMNAIAQAAVNIVEPDPDPKISSIAIDAVTLLAGALPVVVERPDDLDGRTDALLGACLAGAAVGAGVTSLHHRLCHIIGGRFATDHADTHAILLPHTVAYNEPAAPTQAAALATAINANGAANGLRELALRINAPTKLSSLGLNENDLDEVVDIAMSADIRNPRPVERDELARLLLAAFRGDPPQSI